VAADVTQIHQILVNLATNAAHAIGLSGGIIEVHVDSVDVHADTAASGPDLRPGRYVRLMVRDNGSGMSPDVMARIFDPFFTTKPVGQGTGLGLSVVHGIMQSCGGAVRVQSEPGIGTSFHLYFPAVRDAAPADGTAVNAALPGSGQHILLIDDEDSLVRLGTIMLTRQGYRVTGCTDPIAAIREFRRGPHEFHAVVTDLSMPGMSGFDCARELLVTRPDIPIVLTSGYLRPEDEAGAKQIGIRAVITKPAALDQLAEILSQVVVAAGA
jgi:CheY-like chemotaxis protein/anti-sigma regulatory factor (Ser/Thr protein kinase)